MKRQSLVVLLAIVCCLAVLLCACTVEEPQEHKCQHECPVCHGCLSDCTDPVCANKCKGHEEEKHVCQHQCPECGKCTDETCTDPVCADKCKGHVKVSKILVNTDDENEGTLESPRSLTVTQGKTAEFTYSVQPRDVENKSITWTLGSIVEGKFVAATEAAKLTVTDSGSKVVVAAASDATNMTLEGKAADNGGAVVYVAITVIEYFPVTAIEAANLKAVEGKDYNYELTTALYTEWDMTDGILARGQDLLDGKVFGGSQAPRNLTYYANIRNVGLRVLPENASETDVNITYSADNIVAIDAAGNLKVTAAGETIVTITSTSETDVAIKIKITVVDSLYRGITKEAYDNAADAANVSGGWDLDTDHNNEKQFSRYDDWHLVMVHSNEKRGGTGDDGNQKIFYMGEATRPYGICLENNVNAGSGASLENSASLMWAKMTIPESAITFNVKISNNDKTFGQYRVLFVKEDGSTVVLSDGWVGFASGNNESTQKFVIPDELKGVKGAMVIEHRMTVADVNAELQIKVLKFEGQINVSSVVFDTAAGTYKQGARTIKITARVKPDNATNDKVTYEMADSSKAGVTVDANGNVTIAEDAIGEYHIIAKSVADPTKTAEYVLTITADEIEVNEWNGKDAILNGVSDVKWSFINDGHDDGVGEGADLSIRNSVTYAAIQLENRKIKSSSFILTFGARVFVRAGETYPKFVVKVIDGDTETLIRGIGQTEDWFYVESEATQYCSYDLSAYIGKTVSIQIGITEGSHAVVQVIKFAGNEQDITVWKDKAALLNADFDAWTIVGSTDAGVGEGADIKETNSYLSNSFVIGKSYNASFSFGARVFNRSGETYPDIKVVVVVGDQETIVRANGVDADTVHVESNDVQTFTYDLSAFVGQTVEIRIQLANNATHCVIANITMGAIA